MSHDNTDLVALGCFLPRAPTGFGWRALQAETDCAVLRETWNGLEQTMRDTSIWATWRNCLVFPESGDFARGFVHVIGLCSRDGSIAAIVAEAEAITRAGLGEVVFHVRPDFRGQGLGRLALSAGVGLARWRARRAVICQYGACGPMTACPRGVRMLHQPARHGHYLEAHYGLTRRRWLAALCCRHWKRIAASLAPAVEHR